MTVTKGKPLVFGIPESSVSHAVIPESSAARLLESSPWVMNWIPTCLWQAGMTVRKTLGWTNYDGKEDPSLAGMTNFFASPSLAPDLPSPA
jgi:hypothetical protein